MKTPIAVLISDVHYNLQTLDLARKSVEMAMDKALELKVPFIVAGDLHDTKAILRGECVASLIDTFKSRPKLDKIVLTGNHDLINHHDLTRHSLEFLRDYCLLVDYPMSFGRFFFVPYQSSNEQFMIILKQLDLKNKIIIAHQGVQGAYMGEYLKDESSVSPEHLPGLRIISGHYHRKQDITLPNIGLWSYIGNPYTLSFAEANDGPKGFCVLYSDGSLEQVQTKLRSHYILELDVGDKKIPSYPSDSLLWVKIKGPKSLLRSVNKEEYGKLLGSSNFRLDLIPTDNEETVTISDKLTPEQTFDTFIDSMSETDKQKDYLKRLWRETIKS